MAKNNLAKKTVAVAGAVLAIGGASSAVAQEVGTSFSTRNWNNDKTITYTFLAGNNFGRGKWTYINNRGQIVESDNQSYVQGAYNNYLASQPRYQPQLDVLPERQSNQPSASEATLPGFPDVTAREVEERNGRTQTPQTESPLVGEIRRLTEEFQGGQPRQPYYAPQKEEPVYADNGWSWRIGLEGYAGQEGRGFGNKRVYGLTASAEHNWGRVGFGPVIKINFSDFSPETSESTTTTGVAEERVGGDIYRTRIDTEHLTNETQRRRGGIGFEFSYDITDNISIGGSALVEAIREETRRQLGSEVTFTQNGVPFGESQEVMGEEDIQTGIIPTLAKRLDVCWKTYGIDVCGFVEDVTGQEGTMSGFSIGIGKK
ncbi:MAG: hypothetical protein ABIH49_01285 [archaeon]